MPNQIDSSGLQVKTVAEIIASITASLQAIYGADINVDQNSPDGQLINIFAQAAVDNLELLAAIDAQFDPDQAFGVVLDQRVAMNGIERRAGTYTLQPVSVTVDRAMTLVGLDGAITPIGTEFVVADDAGNEFILVATQVIGGAGTASYSFRAKNIGAVLTTQNTITNQVTVTLGVTAVNNPLVYTTLGVNEETDTELKLRRQKSFYKQAHGNADAVEAELLATTGVTDAIVIEDTGAHTLWCIVEGGADADIADVIYSKKNAGCGLVGDDATVAVSRPNGQTIAIAFDRPISQDLYMKATLAAKSGSETFDLTFVKNALVAALTYKLGQPASINELMAALIAIEPNAYFSALGVSLSAGSYTDFIGTTDNQHKFILTAAHIALTQ